ncbi:MAG: 50S ribosomal protein L28 [Alphaproteobacteria bacterium]|nr:50S ribosomal protein L28 [Alphaproteobacteria bacterium]
MSRRCELTGKTVVTGNNVSHAVNRTRRRFYPNLQRISVNSETLKQDFSVRICTQALRTLEVNGGLDNWLLKTSNTKLTLLALSLKKRILRAKTAAA